MVFEKKKKKKRQVILIVFIECHHVMTLWVNMGLAAEQLLSDGFIVKLVFWRFTVRPEHSVS
jgi:hypothetical protein